MIIKSFLLKFLDLDISIKINNKIYNFIGSDAHNDKKKMIGINNSLKLINKKNEFYKNVFSTSCEHLIENRSIEFEGEKIEKKKWYLIMKYL